MIDLRPRAPVRRFDVFAEYNRVKNETAGLAEDRAKGDVVWPAKVVAGRRFRGKASSVAQEHTYRPDHEEERSAAGYRSAASVPRTAATFDAEIVERMGEQFYRQVFRPAIIRAFGEGKSYEEIRDSLRAQWK